MYDIPGYLGYQATHDGEIIKTRTGRTKLQRPARNGAMQVHIGKSTRMVHDLVARAFYGHPVMPGYRVKHRNGILSDNNVENLLWSGSSVSQEPTLPAELQCEYERLEAERLELVNLMQN